MRLISLFCLVLLLSGFFPFNGYCKADKLKLIFAVSARDSIATARTVRELSARSDISDRCILEFYTDREIRSSRVSKEDVNTADVILVDFMKREFDDFLSTALGNRTPDGKNIDVYSLRCSYLAHKLKKKGFSPDIRSEIYYQPPTVENLKNMVFMVLSHKGMKMPYKAPFVLPDAAIFHPEADTLFSDFNTYLGWYKKTGKFTSNGFWVGIHTFRTSAIRENGKLEGHLITALEKKGINALPVFGKPPYHQSLESYFLDESGHSRVDALCGFSFRFLRGYPEKTREILTRINAPVFIPLEAHGITIDQWKRSDRGISTLRTAWQVCIPEQNGGVEPTVVGGKTAVRLKGMTDILYDRVPLPDQIDFLIKRIQAWQNLKTKPNHEKKIALLYWNHPPGKQNIGGSYMNCFRSIAVIASELQKQGYTIHGKQLTEDMVKERILLGARNVGSWAPGELDRLIASKSVIKIPVSEYKEWFAALPPGFQSRVVEQWGEPEVSNIMIKDGSFIIPRITLGNLMVLPQPARGFGEDPEKLYHDPKIHPHHQYIAFYLWLKKKFKADAVISLGKHGTHEWLPGKQIGLSITDPPDLLIQDIPNIYPYIVDNVGEGIQAKRRGRGVIIDHLIPPLKKGGAYMEYRKLTALIDALHAARKTDETLAREKLNSVEALIEKLGIHKDLGIDAFGPEVVEEVEHYILELQETMIPYGHHTFGVSPHGESLDALTDAVCDASPEIEPGKMKQRIAACGKNELTSLVEALNGGYVASGEGNDPVRNPDAIPTGRNFYGFNIDKVPSREAWTLGKRLSDEMIDTYRKKHGVYPEKLGLILWSTELQRNEGASVAAVLHLLGIVPVWDKKDHVVDIVPIPGAVLNRPRIDVLVQASGLFRDSFAKLIKLMDRAVLMASSLKDVENYISVHNQKIEAALLENGYSRKEAENFSRARIFAPMPGAYSHALQELIPNSGVWEDEQEIADVFIHHYSFAYGHQIWGKPLKSGYLSNLEDVKMTMHTRSSNLYNILDNDDMFAFLGGLSLAVKHQTGSFPETVVANMQDGKTVTIEDLPKAIGKALRTRYLNPKWIQGMKQEGYSGAKAMNEFVEYLWGFQVTSPWAVDKTHWEEIHDVYIQDKYGQNLKQFFDENNPWALQSISARMLEADRKGYWKAPEEMKKNIARTFAVNVIEKGVACCEHTCNNPMFQNYVTNFLSLSGLLTPKQMNAFKMALAKATGKTLEELKNDHKKARQNLDKVIEKIQKSENVQAKTHGESIEGFEMVEEKAKETSITSSGSAWLVMVIVTGMLVLLFAGYKRIKV
jgi:cobaltochelatase CobN